MKKLLLILLCVPLITLFNSCSSGGTTPPPASFLEVQDGTVWVLQDTSNYPFGVFSDGTTSISNVGFYNADNLAIFKNSLVDAFNCYYFSEGLDTLDYNVVSQETYTIEQTVLSNSPNELSIQAVGIYLSPSYSISETSTITYKFSTSSPNSNQMNLELDCINCGDFNNITGIYNFFYIKSSTETNLSCN